PGDSKVFFLRLCSPFVADYYRVGDFRLVQVLSVVHERHHHKRRFVGMSRYAIVAGHHMKVDFSSRVRRTDERNGFKSQGYLAEALEVDRVDFDVLGGIAAQVVQRKDIAAPLVVVALYCRQHDPRPVSTAMDWLLRRVLGFDVLDFRWAHRQYGLRGV